jgi:hypothetical protein
MWFRRGENALTCQLVVLHHSRDDYAIRRYANAGVSMQGKYKGCYLMK